ncbi:uncharacterized protein LOC121108890 [Gallus gallus]|uniref:uncharacterized protein LOC121108890 n=1 Tax=Gallus gallus TaxID=9031 RepID=UPI001AE19D23|nr:uncharacterized protein LOC121108890 [Gallus gallus]
MRCFQLAQKGLALLGGLGFACMKDLGFARRFWGLLGGLGACMHGMLWDCLEGFARMHEVFPACTEGFCFAWRVGVCMHERPGVCLEVWGLACMEGFGFAWRGLHACMRCFQLAEKGFALLGGLGFACMKDLGFAWRFWGLLGGFGACMHGGLWVCLEGFACTHEAFPACTEGFCFAWRVGVCMHERPGDCLEVLGLACMEGFGFAWGGLHACMRCFQLAQKGFALLGGLGFACMKDLGFAWRFWGLLGGLGACLHGMLWVCLEGFARVHEVFPACTEGFCFAWRVGVCMHERPGVCLEGFARMHELFPACTEGFCFAWRVGVCMHERPGVCTEVLGFAWRFWGLHAWRALGLLGGVCMHA